MTILFGMIWPDKLRGHHTYYDWITRSSRVMTGMCRQSYFSWLGVQDGIAMGFALAMTGGAINNGFSFNGFRLIEKAISKLTF